MIYILLHCLATGWSWFLSAIFTSNITDTIRPHVVNDKTTPRWVFNTLFTIWLSFLLVISARFDWIRFTSFFVQTFIVTTLVWKTLIQYHLIAEHVMDILLLSTNNLDKLNKPLSVLITGYVLYPTHAHHFESLVLFICRPNHLERAERPSRPKPV